MDHQPPRDTLSRSATDRYVAGVAGGLAAHLRLAPWLVRAAFVVVTVLFGGLGVVIYVLLWAVTPEQEAGAITAERAARPSHRLTGWHWLIFVGAVLVLLGISLRTPLGAIVTDVRYAVPILLLALGAFIAWYQFEPQVGGGVGWDPGHPRWRYAVQVVLGGLVAAGGGLVLMTQGRGVEGVWNGALAALAVLVGVGVVATPFVLRLLRNLQREQAARARATERADIAAHLHDSVLQTLALIQRRAEDPQTVVRLARRQERELRSWLYAGDPRETDSLTTALTTVVHDVEDDHGIPVDVVVTGDRVIDESGEALVKATREAVLNAVRHGAPPVSVYAELGPAGAEVFVRDHGVGFDLTSLDAVPEDRLGVRESIIGRMDRAGGRAAIRRLDDGTEI
ncbi:MAG TPA: PspC domain-containing protein, partial [Dermatophilaceae bacterium]|nr:PspC domain-containing protein [Dermatophilaceae bacterium]